LLVVPSDDVAKAFGIFAELWFRKASQAERESRTLAALRDALLPKLIRGEIRVKDAERFLRERRLRVPALRTSASPMSPIGTLAATAVWAW